MIVLKFGGTSVRNSEWMDKALAIARGQIERAPVLVSSAMGKTTDKLVEIATLSEQGNEADATLILKEIQDSHIGTAKEFLSGSLLDECLKALDGLFQELGSLIKGMCLLKECSGRTSDFITSMGERLSTTLIAYRGRGLGMDTDLLDSRKFIKTDANFKSASLLEEITRKKVTEMVKPGRNKLLVAQGFIGSTVEGITTTLGRGGSDYTATIIGSILKAEEVQIWTDVDGIMTSDPRVVNKTQTIPVISYKEAAELAYFGARVIHPSTIQPAVNLGIPVWVKNTGNPEAEGTKISPRVPALGPKAIAFKKDVTLVTITSSRMLLAYGFLRRIFEIFENYKTSVDLIATSEVTVSVTIDNSESIEYIARELEAIGTVTVEPKMGTLCLVGQELWKDSVIIAKVFDTLKAIPIRMVSLGSSDTNLSFVVANKWLEESVVRLHKEFFE